MATVKATPERPTRLRRLTAKAACDGVPDAVVGAGAVPPLVALASRGADALADRRQPGLEAGFAADLLCDLALATAHRAAIVEARGHEPLLSLVRLGTHRGEVHFSARAEAGLVEKCAFALGSLAFNHPPAVKAMNRLGALEVVAKLAREGNPEQQRVAEYALANLSVPEPPPAPPAAPKKKGKKGKK